MADYSLMYRTTLRVTVGSSGVVGPDADDGYYKDFTIPEVALGMAKVESEIKYRRIGDEYGASVKFQDNVTLRLSWYGLLQNDEATGLDEIISADVEVQDLDGALSDVKEILFRAQRILGYLGENTVQDLLEYDAAGNVVSYRLRVFDSRTNAEACTPDRPDGSSLQTGELARVTMSQDIVMAKNDRALLIRVLTDVLDTPGNT